MGSSIVFVGDVGYFRLGFVVFVVLVDLVVCLFLCVFFCFKKGLRRWVVDFSLYESICLFFVSILVGVRVD